MCALAFLENGHESIVAVHGTVHMQGFFTTAALVALGNFHTLYKTSEKADIVFLRNTYIKTDLLTVRIWN